MTNMFYIGLQVLGLICTLPLSRKIPRWFLVSTSFLWGMLLWMGCSLVIALFGIPYTWLSTGIFLLLILIISVYFVINTGTYMIPVRDWLMIAGSLVAIILLSTLLTETSYVFSTTDSFNYIYHGKVLARSGFVNWTINNFTKLGSFSSIFQMSSHLLPGEYISGYQTILAAELLLVVYIGTWKELKQEFRSATALIISTALILVLGSVTFLEHAFYIHNNLPAGLLLFLTLFSFWHYFKTNAGEWSLIGSIALVGFSFTRIEGPLYAVLILLIIISIQPQPYRKTLRMVLPYTLITTLWHIFLLLNAVQNEQLSKTNLLLIICALIGLAFLALISKWIPGLIDMLPKILISVLFFSLILAVLIEPEHMIISLTHFWQNLVNVYYWSWTWLVIAAFLPFMLLKNGSHPENHLLLYSCAVYILIVLLLVLARIPYRLGQTDSSNRLMLQILPVLLFAIASSSNNLKQWFSTNPSE